MGTIFITGASSGIGAAATRLFAGQGWNVIATMRNTEKADELKCFPQVTVKELDVTNDRQVEDCVAEVLEQTDVDVLFGNAGYGMSGPLELVPMERAKKLFDTDVFGAMKVMQEFIPYFKRRKSGLILTTASLVSVIGFPRDGVYGAAKHAIAGMCESLYYELKPYHVMVKLLLPGAVMTNFMNGCDSFPDPFYEEAGKNLSRLLIPDFDAMPTAEETAQDVWIAATDGKDQFHYPSGQAAKELYQRYMDMGVEQFKAWFTEQLFSDN